MGDITRAPCLVAARPAPSPGGHRMFSICIHTSVALGKPPVLHTSSERGADSHFCPETSSEKELSRTAAERTNTSMRA